MNHILAVLVGVILLLNLLPCAFAQSNLRNHSDEQRLTVAQQNVGDAATNDAPPDSLYYFHNHYDMMTCNVKGWSQRIRY